MYSKSATANGTCDPVIDWIKTGLWSLCHLNLLNYIIGRRLWISYTQEPWFVSAVSIFFFFILLLPKGKNIQTSQRTSHHDEWKNTGRGEDDSEEQRDGEQRNGATDEEGQRERGDPQEMRGEDWPIPPRSFCLLSDKLSRYLLFIWEFRLGITERETHLPYWSLITIWFLSLVLSKAEFKQIYLTLKLEVNVVTISALKLQSR